MTLNGWHLELDAYGEPLWGIEERDEMIAAGVLIPFERCEHESLDGHWWFTTDEKDRVVGEYWCPGAGIGDTPVDSAMVGGGR